MLNLFIFFKNMNAPLGGKAWEISICGRKSQKRISLQAARSFQSPSGTYTKRCIFCLTLLSPGSKFNTYVQFYHFSKYFYFIFQDYWKLYVNCGWRSGGCTPRKRCLRLRRHFHIDGSDWCAWWPPEHIKFKSILCPKKKKRPLYEQYWATFNGHNDCP